MPFFWLRYNNTRSFLGCCIKVGYCAVCGRAGSGPSPYCPPPNPRYHFRPRTAAERARDRPNAISATLGRAPFPGHSAPPFRGSAGEVGKAWVRSPRCRGPGARPVLRRHFHTEGVSHQPLRSSLLRRGPVLRDCAWLQPGRRPEE